MDSGFFQVIRLPLVVGDPRAVFAQPESGVVSQAPALKYFGHKPALGKTIAISTQVCDPNGQSCQSQERPLVVTGIVRDLPHNTQLKAELLIPNTSGVDPMSQEEKKRWMWFVGWGYVALAPGANPAAVETKLKAIIDHSLDPKKKSTVHIRGSDWMTPHLAPLRDDHLSTDQYGGMTPAGSWTAVYGFAAIGLLILLVACFNFMNLATARAMLRAREISLRKCMGASRRQLIVQFLGESVLFALVALVFALALVEILLPSFNSFLGKSVMLGYVADWPLLAAIFSIAVLTGLLSGVYPALVLSGFRPVSILRANTTKLSRSGLLRTSMVVLQFAVSIGLGVAVIVVFAQISFARQLDVGYRKDGVVLINAGIMSSTAQDSFAKALQANPRISAVAISDAVPLGNRTLVNSVHMPGTTSDQLLRTVAITPSYMKLYGVRSCRRPASIRDLYGRDRPVINKKGDPDGTPFNVLVDVTGAARLGFTAQSAIGKTFIARAEQTMPVTIVGVVDDVKMDGPRYPVKGTVYHYDPNIRAPFISVRVQPGQLADTLSFIDKTWRSFAPTVALRSHFLSDDFNQQFQADEKQGTIFALFVGIALFIAGLGLFGLAAFTVERRTKEIRCAKDIRRKHARCRFSAAVAVFHSRFGCQRHRLASRLVLSAGLAGRLCLSHHIEPALFRRRGLGSSADRLDHRAQPRPTRRPRQSHPRLAHRIGEAMFRNYLVIALRNIARHKLYSFINIAGLAVGLACAILIILFVRDELSWDAWIPGCDKIYRVETTFHVPGRSDIVTAQTTMPLTVAMHDQIPEVREQTRLVQQSMTMIAGDRQFSEMVGTAVDPNFLQMIPLPLVSRKSAHRTVAPRRHRDFPAYRVQIFRRCRSHRKDTIHRPWRLRCGHGLRQHPGDPQSRWRDARSAA